MFFRLFTLLEDECHKLDVHMATMTSPEESDRQSYITYASKVHQERTLLDEIKTLKDGLDFLEQTRSFLLLTTTTPTTSTPSPTIQAVTNVIEGKKKNLTELVRLTDMMHTLE